MSNARFSILQAKAVKDKKISDSQFRTLAALGMYADENGWCFPSLTTLGKDLSKSKQAVGRDTIALKKLGYLQTKPRFDKNGSRRSNLYRLRFDPPVNMDDSTPSTPDVDTPSTPDVDVNDPINDPVKRGTKVPGMSIENQIFANVEKVILPDETHARRVDFANLVAMGTPNPPEAYMIAMAFQDRRDITMPESKVKGQRKAIKEMLEMGVTAEHVRQAVGQLLDRGMTVADFYSVSKTAVDLANKPKVQENKTRRFERLDR